MQHSFNVQIATEYGINAAIILNNLYFWIEKNKANNTHYYDGHFWTYNSRKAFADLFPYMNERQVDYALKKLKDDGIIITRNYNKSTYDRTLWYAITKTGYCKLQNCNMQVTKLLDGDDKNVTSYTNINTDNKTQIENNEESTNIDSCAQPEVEHEKTTKIQDSAKTIMSARTVKRTLLPQINSDLEELKSQVKKPVTNKKSKEPKNSNEDTKDFKKNSFLRKAVEITVTQIGIVDEEKITIIKDWLEVCYNKGVKTSEPRFAHIISDLENLIKNYPWEQAEKILHSAIVSGYANLSFAIQNVTKSSYNKPHTKADEYKFPGIRPDETVEEYIARTYESPEEHQARIKQMQDDVKSGKLKTY